MRLQEDKISALRISENALNVLDNLVEKHKQGTHETVYQPKQRCGALCCSPPLSYVCARLTRDASSFALRCYRLELTFYKNSIIHWFVLEGIVSAALYASIKPHIRVAQVHHQCALLFLFIVCLKCCSPYFL